MNLDDMKFSEVKALKKAFFEEFGKPEHSENVEKGLCDQVGKKVIVRTYSAGVYYGTLLEKHLNECYVVNARRLWRFECNVGIELGDVSINGIRSDSRIGPVVEKVWLMPIEILNTSSKCQSDIEGAAEATRD